MEREYQKLLSENELRELLASPLPTTIVDIREELQLLDDLISTLPKFREIIPDVDLRRDIVKRRGILLEREIVAEVGLPVGEDEVSHERFLCALECKNTIEALEELLKKADACGIGDEVRRRLKDTLGSV